MVNIEGTNLWYDPEEYRESVEFLKQKEKEYWDWHFSGQRTIDMFGAEGAKRVLETQARRDKKLMFNHRSRGFRRP